MHRQCSLVSYQRSWTFLEHEASTVVRTRKNMARGKSKCDKRRLFVGDKSRALASHVVYGVTWCLCAVAAAGCCVVLKFLCCILLRFRPCLPASFQRSLISWEVGVNMADPSKRSMERGNVDRYCLRSTHNTVRACSVFFTYARVPLFRTDLHIFFFKYGLGLFGGESLSRVSNPNLPIAHLLADCPA